MLAQVLLLSNVDVKGGLANGTRGVVKGIVSIRDYLHQVSPDWSATAHWQLAVLAFNNPSTVHKLDSVSTTAAAVSCMESSNMQV